ncbi:MAG: aminotransferase class I/II-fold pyridoxal phosphate-dependent enzyme [Candidatus Nitrosocaldus sp.]
MNHDHMKGSEWLRYRLSELSRLEGYTKPEKLQKSQPQPQSILRMDTNENLALPLEFVRDVLHEVLEDVDPRLYPEEYDELRSGVASYLGLSKDNIVIGSGSDQLIDLALGAFGYGRRSITLKPTFTFYRDRCLLHGIDIEELALDDHDFSFSVDSMLKSNADILYICSPNNPTGNQFSRDIMLDVIDGFDGLIMVDEAYAEFAGYSLKDLAVNRDNLIIFRTFSKAFGLAGARVGYAIACKEMIDVFNRVIQYPYAVSSISLKAAISLLKRFEKVKRVIEDLKAEREWLYGQLSMMLGLRAFRSDANFILFDVDEHEDVYRRLRDEEGILVRRIGQVGCYRGCLRVTVGSRDMDERFLYGLSRAICNK